MSCDTSHESCAFWFRYPNYISLFTCFPQCPWNIWYISFAVKQAKCKISINRTKPRNIFQTSHKQINKQKTPKTELIYSNQCLHLTVAPCGTTGPVPCLKTFFRTPPSPVRSSMFRAIRLKGVWINIITTIISYAC